jgi:uncharacterized membrane protein YtjA (UPF0391 family)
LPRGAEPGQPIGVDPVSHDNRNFFAEKEIPMLGWAVTFLVIALIALIALIAAALGFGGIAGTSAGIAQILFFVFIVLFVVAMIARALKGRPPV